MSIYTCDEIFICNICNKEFKNKRSLISHSNFHTKGHKEKTLNRPNQISKNRENNLKKKLKNIEIFENKQIKCKFCNVFLEYKQRHNSFCTKSCGAKFNNQFKFHTLETKSKLSIAAKRHNVLANEIRREKYNSSPSTCVVCYINKPYELRHIKTCNSKECLSKLISKNNIKNNNGGFKHNNIKYKDVYLDSTWELKVAISLDEHNIKWNRPKCIYFIDRNNIKRRYHSDFYLIDYNVYLDPKNDYALKCQKEKLEDIIISTKIKLLILNKNQLTWEIIKELLLPLR